MSALRRGSCRPRAEVKFRARLSGGPEKRPLPPGAADGAQKGKTPTPTIAAKVDERPLISPVRFPSAAQRNPRDPRYIARRHQHRSDLAEGDPRPAPRGAPRQPDMELLRCRREIGLIAAVANFRLLWDFRVESYSDRRTISCISTQLCWSFWAGFSCQRCASLHGNRDAPSQRSQGE